MSELRGRPGIATWSAERRSPSELIAVPGRGLAYEDEIPHDRDVDGVLWARMSLNHGGGRPEFGRVHPTRQRRAMRRLLCQVCGGPADRTEDGVLWLLKDDRSDWVGWPEGMAATHPPVCRSCAKGATQSCAHLRAGFVAVRVKDSGSCGVYGTLYRPGPLRPRPVADVIVTSDDPQVRWILAAQMVRVLRGCQFVDLGAAVDDLGRAA
ncbi:hypothetical protein P3T37_002457 [Kitasatospora sp. MAA4]|uniref:hypothetical protein n=1 Tax=Kitasatospora sp. MAA4 TaxID=3035093 RepID=UPI0024744906|nr:hypothetical protein [Kitasatospora sp. MAA4]MDH6133063.1 hypothetical protein [Kitasatospora sp. MAA4]